MEALKAIKIKMMEGLCFYFFQIPGNKGFYISCATPNWRIFLLKINFNDLKSTLMILAITVLGDGRNWLPERQKIQNNA